MLNMGTRYTIISKSKDISFQLPKTIKHKATRKVICDIVRELCDRGELTVGDIPQLHRMATPMTVISNVWMSCLSKD